MNANPLIEEIRQENREFRMFLAGYEAATKDRNVDRQFGSVQEFRKHLEAEFEAASESDTLDEVPDDG